MLFFEIIMILTAHWVADFPLQGDFLANMKGKNNFLLFVHAFIYTGVMSFVLALFGVYSIPVFFTLLISHIIVDYWKCHFANKDTALTTSLYIDQAIHIALLVGIILGNYLR